jgi:hypothetical protein
MFLRNGQHLGAYTNLVKISSHKNSFTVNIHVPLLRIYYLFDYYLFNTPPSPLDLLNRIPPQSYFA